MTTASNRLKRSKTTENRVVRFLTGNPHALRDWKDDWDVKLLDHAGVEWVIEIKSHEWRKGPGGLRTLLTEALEQAGKSGQHCAAFYCPKGAECGDGIVMFKFPNDTSFMLFGDEFLAELGPFTDTCDHSIGGSSDDASPEDVCLPQTAPLQENEVS